MTDDTLYILGHGNAAGGTLTYKRPPNASHPLRDPRLPDPQPGRCAAMKHLDKWHVDPVTLGALLEDEGLPKTHKLIELVMCFGAGLSIEAEQTVQPFAQRLAGTLAGFGYAAIQVKSVTGMTVANKMTGANKTRLAVAPYMDVRKPTSEQAKAGDRGQITIKSNNEVPSTDPAYEQFFRFFTGK
jgi:hypothetical protein